MEKVEDVLAIGDEVTVKSYRNRQSRKNKFKHEGFRIKTRRKRRKNRKLVEKKSCKIKIK